MARSTSPTTLKVETISALELSQLKKAKGRITEATQVAVAARSALQNATAAESFLLEMVREKYGILPGDSIDEQGRITRKPLPPAPVASRHKGRR